MINLSSLNRQTYRSIGLAISLTGIAILIILLLLNFSYIENWEQRIFIINHYIIILGFLLLTYSLEKIEDERVQNIRHRVLRLSHMLTITGIIAYAAISILNRVEFNLFVIFYIIEAALILYQLLFRLFLRINPTWIFKETPRQNARSIIPVSALIFLIAWVVYAVIEYKI